MNAIVLKSVHHLYGILKAYLALAMLGASAVVSYELLFSRPLAMITVFASFMSLAITVLLLAEASALVSDENFGDEEPPKFPKLFMMLILPKHLSQPILADLNHDFRHLMLRHGRKSAAIWYALVSIGLVLRVSILHITFGARRRIAEDIVKK